MKFYDVLVEQKVFIFFIIAWVGRMLHIGGLFFPFHCYILFTLRAIFGEKQILLRGCLDYWTCFFPVNPTCKWEDCEALGVHFTFYKEESSKKLLQQINN